MHTVCSIQHVFLQYNVSKQGAGQKLSSSLLVMDIVWDDGYCLDGVDKTFISPNDEHVTVHNAQGKLKQELLLFIGNVDIIAKMRRRGKVEVFFPQKKSMTLPSMWLSRV